MGMHDPPPPYRPADGASSKRPRGPATISTLPLHLLHRIISLTLDPRATPSQWRSDEEEERVRRLWALFRGLRGVDRRFLLVSTSILRSHFLAEYMSHLPRGSTADPYPSTTRSSHLTDATSTGDTALPSLLSRSRETAVFDRFIAIQVGTLLRSTESSLSEPSEAIPDLFQRLQPCARIEDLLVATLPPSLIVESGQPRRMIPLPHPHLCVQMTPGWVKLLLCSHPVGMPSNGKVGREVVLEVRRQDTPENSVKRIQDALEDMQSGIIHWGDRVV